MEEETNKLLFKEKIEKIKSVFNSKTDKPFSKEEANEIIDEIARRIEFERGEMWIESRNEDVINQEIINKSREVADVYFKRKSWENFVDKLTEAILKTVNKSE